VTCRGIALVLATASACAMYATFVGCGDEAARPPAVPVPPVTSATAPARGPDTSVIFASQNGESARNTAPEAGSSATPPPPEPSFGAGSVKPGDVQPFRLVAALRALRASPSGAKIAQLMSVVPAVREAKARTGVDPFADGEWLLVYGPQVAVPGANANVVRHARPEAAVTTAIADGGFEAGDGGGMRADLLGVRDVLLRPQPGTLALVPADRATDLGAALAKPIDPGVKSGELARIFIAEPTRVAHMLSKEVVRASVVVKPHPDGGLDLAADADCADAASCTATATTLDALVQRQNSMIVRIATRSLFSGLAFRADGTKLRATLHVSPEQVDAILGFVRAQLDLPAASP
jgi:hypothetical protein